MRTIFFFLHNIGSKNNSCEICIVDDGDGILGSLKNAGREVDDSLDALKKVLERGLSAKTEYGDFKRGTGIKNIIATLTNNELRGEYFIMSGSAGFLQSAQKGKILFNFANYTWKGTIIMMRLNRPLSQFNLYDYVR